MVAMSRVPAAMAEVVVNAILLGRVADVCRTANATSRHTHVAARPELQAAGAKIALAPPADNK